MVYTERMVVFAIFVVTTAMQPYFVWLPLAYYRMVAASFYFSGCAWGVSRWVPAPGRRGGSCEVGSERCFFSSGPVL